MDIADDFKDLEQACASLRAIAALPPEISELRRPEISGWSALEHVAHVSLANELIVRNLDSLAAGQGPLLQESGEPIPLALEVFASGVIPRGKAQSPRMVRPPARIDRELLADWMSGAELGFARIAKSPEPILRATARVPHQLLGPLTAVQWVRFARVHTRHHLAIAYLVLG